MGLSAQKMIQIIHAGYKMRIRLLSERAFEARRYLADIISIGRCAKQPLKQDSFAVCRSHAVPSLSPRRHKHGKVQLMVALPLGFTAPAIQEYKCW